MVESSLPAGEPSGAVCPWCSAPRPDPNAETCPSCGAILVGGSEEALPGLTAVDPVAIVRSKQIARPRSRLLSWLSGDDDEEIFTPAHGQALAPPDLEVRREMFRLELEAEVAALQAENEALLAEAAADGRIVELASEPIDEAADADVTAADGATADEMTAAADAPPAVDDAETPKPA